MNVLIMINMTHLILAGKQLNMNGLWQRIYMRKNKIFILFIIYFNLFIFFKKIHLAIFHIIWGLGIGDC